MGVCIWVSVSVGVHLVLLLQSVQVILAQIHILGPNGSVE